MDLDRKLLDAVRAGRLGGCAELLKAGANPNAWRLGMGSPLIYAVRQGHRGIRDLLLKNGADVDLSSNGRLTPLMLAAGAGDVEACRALLAAGASCSLANDKGERVLSHAARYGQAAVCELLLDSGADINHCDFGQFGQSALANAAGAGCHATVAVLLQRGAAVGVNEIVAASTSNRLEIVEQLLAASDPSKGDLLAEALRGAVLGGFVHLSRALMASGACPSMNNFVDAARKGEVEICEFLIEQGLDVNARNPSGSTPLHAAAKGNSVKVARLLLANGADVNVESDAAGWTPLYEAIHRHGRRDDKMIRFLVANGADLRPLCRCDDELTPFQFAVRSGQTVAVRSLAEEGREDLEQRTFAGQTMEELASIWVEVAAVLRSIAAERAVEGFIGTSDGDAPVSRRRSRMEPI